jgi:hypothetical protein
VEKSARIEAQRAEIARRYKRKKRARPVSIAALRIAELNRLFRARYGATLPEDDCGRDEALVMAHHIARRTSNDGRKIAAWLELHAPWMQPTDIAALVTRVLRKPSGWRADKLAARLNLTAAERRRLRITTIGAVDMDKTERQAARRERKRKAEAARRRALGKRPRQEYEANSISRARPWTAIGMSRATWYRRERCALVFAN